MASSAGAHGSPSLSRCAALSWTRKANATPGSKGRWHAARYRLRMPHLPLSLHPAAAHRLARTPLHWLMQMLHHPAR